MRARRWGAVAAVAARAWSAGVAVVGLMVGTLVTVGAAPAQAAPQTFVVNSAVDATDGSCNVTNCTLREAIAAANATTDADTIHFAIPGAGVHTISLTSKLPDITRPLTIDGFSQAGSAPNSASTSDNAVRTIRLLDGVPTTAAIDGLLVNTTAATIRGLVITGFHNDTGSGSDVNGIRIKNVASPTGYTVVGNAIVDNDFGIIDFGPALRVGGPAPADRNLINRNGSRAVILNGDSVVQGNFIGVSANGITADGNDSGVLVERSGDTIGGTGVGEGNVISGNRVGIEILGLGAGAIGTIIRGNLIGTTADGTGALGNSDFGIGLNRDPIQGILVGGTAAGAGNIIAHNGGAGVSIRFGTGTAVRRNAIFDNGGLGIDLGADDTVQTNDTGDGDTGANNLQNFPVLTSAVVGATQTTINGSLNSTPNTTFAVDLFRVASCDAPSKHGEGEVLLGSLNVTTAAGGNATFTKTFGVQQAGASITATATSPTGDTSEFSACRIIVPEITVTDVTVTEGDSGTVNAVFQVKLGHPSTHIVTVDFFTDDGTAHAPGDYRDRSGTRVFEPGDTSLPVTIRVKGDTAVEPNETFTLDIDDAVRGSITDDTGTGTITNDD